MKVTAYGHTGAVLVSGDAGEQSAPEHCATVIGFLQLGPDIYASTGACAAIVYSTESDTAQSD
jgi:hypothetical protein